MEWGNRETMECLKQKFHYSTKYLNSSKFVSNRDFHPKQTNINGTTLMYHYQSNIWRLYQLYLGRRDKYLSAKWQFFVYNFVFAHLKMSNCRGRKPLGIGSQGHGCEICKICVPFTVWIVHTKLSHQLLAANIQQTTELQFLLVSITKIKLFLLSSAGKLIFGLASRIDCLQQKKLLNNLLFTR